MQITKASAAIQTESEKRAIVYRPFPVIRAPIEPQELIDPEIKNITKKTENRRQVGSQIKPKPKP